MDMEQPPQRDFSALAAAFKKRYPDQADPAMGEQGMATQLAMPDSQAAPAPTMMGGQEQNQVGGDKSEAQKIIEILGARLKKIV